MVLCLFEDLAGRFEQVLVSISGGRSIKQKRGRIRRDKVRDEDNTHAIEQKVMLTHR